MRSKWECPRLISQGKGKGVHSTDSYQEKAGWCKRIRAVTFEQTGAERVTLTPRLKGGEGAVKWPARTRKQPVQRPRGGSNSGFLRNEEEPAWRERTSFRESGSNTSDQGQHGGRSSCLLVVLCCKRLLASFRKGCRQE